MNVCEKFPEFIGEGKNSKRRGQKRKREKSQERGRGKGRGRGRSAQSNVVSVNTPHKEGLAAQKVGRGFSKEVSTGAASGSQYSIPGPSNWNGGGKPRSLFRQDTTSSSQSCSTRGSLDKIDSRKKHNLAEKTRRLKLKDLKDKLQDLVPELINKPRTSTVKVLTSARKCVEELAKEEKETRQRVKYHKDKNKSLKRYLKKLRKKLEDLCDDSP